MSRKTNWLVYAAVVLVALCISTAAWAKVTLYTDNSGEAAWWFSHEHLDASLPPVTVLCASNDTDYCTKADYWNVELATYASDGDWAYLSLDTAERMTLAAIATSGFTYKTTGVQTESGPHMGYALLDVSGNTYLAISAGATPQTASCNAFDATAATWWWGTWTENSDGNLDPSTFTQVGTGTWAALQASAYGGHTVDAALVIMGVTGGTVATPRPYATGGTIYTGQALVDKILVSWTSGATSYGGTYLMEAEWPTSFNFDDSSQLPGHDPYDRPLQEERWCRCSHCMTVDDSNLWDVIYQSDLTAPPAGVVPFASPSYALYFGNVAKGNYDTGDAAVGVICSTYNELNPGDEYLSVSFDYFRQVEQYAGPYDWTYVQVKFYKEDGSEAWSSIPAGWFNPFDYGAGKVNRNPGDIHYNPAQDSDIDTIRCPNTQGNDYYGWKTVWYKDATDTNEGAWTNAVATHYLNSDEDPYTDDVYRIKIPPLATRVKIRFGFNSVDGSNNSSLGWVVDNIRKTHSPEPSGCQITTATLPQAEVGVKYETWLNPNCQTNSKTVRRYELVDVTKDGVSMGTTLPRRLALDSCGRIYGEPDPGTSGTYVLTLRLYCVDGGSATKQLILNIRAPGDQGSTQSMIGQLGQLPEYFSGTTSGQWTVDSKVFGTTAACPNLWHETANVKYALNTTALTTEYGHVAYFGLDDDGIPTDLKDPNYECSRAKGCLTSPMYQIVKPEHDGQELVIGFKSWRNVEYFPGGDFDATYVEVRLEGQSSWTEVWRKTSKQTSLKAWEWVEIHTRMLLKYGTKVQVRFCFDSVDAFGNGKQGEAYGWLIDEVSLYAGSAEMGIVNCPRAETSINDYYNELMTVSGGAAPSSGLIWEISQGSLPAGLGLVPNTSNRREAWIQGVPRESTAGPVTFTIRVRTADWSEVATKTCTIAVSRDIALFVEDFEQDPKWSLGGLWHFTNHNGVTGVPCLSNLNHAAYYGRGDNTAKPDYDTGAVSSGMLTVVDSDPVAAGDQPISLAGSAAFTIQFDFWRWVESVGGAYDRTKLQVKLGSGDWNTIWQLDSSTSSDATNDPTKCPWPQVKLGPYSTGGATTMLIRFVFDSVDKWYNKYTGWLVDNIVIKGASSGSPLPTMSADRLETRGEDTLEVMNIPNPITDVHTTTFTVRSTDVAAMRIVIFDLAGNKVYEEEVPGNELVWHTDNNYGEYLANGIYLYRAYILVNGVWVETTAQKLVILR